MTTDLWLTSSRLLLIAVIAGLAYVCYQYLLCKPVPGIPHHKDAANTVLGDFPKLLQAIKDGKPIHSFIASQNTTLNSPIIQFFKRPSARPWVIVSDFRESQDILLRRTKEFDRSEATANLFGGIAPQFHMNWKSDTQIFKANRNLLKDLMTPAFLKQVAAPQIHASVSNLVDLWSLKAHLAQNRPFNAVQDVFDIMLDVITGVTFGLDTKQSITATRVNHIKNLADPIPKFDDQGTVTFDLPPKPAAYEALEYGIYVVHDIMRSPSPAISFWLKKKTRTFRNAYRIKEDMISNELEKCVARVKQGDSTERCALDNILQRELHAAEKANRPADYHTRSIYDELFGFLLAGFETTASTMAWGYKFIAAHPQVQDTCRAQLRAAFPVALAEGRLPSAEEIVKAHIPYLEATIEEIHRCAQVFPMVIRRAQVDTTVLGYVIPKGTEIVMVTSGPSYNLDAFPISENQRSESSRTAKHQQGAFDPNDRTEFKPERWLRKDDKGEDVFDANAGPFLAFSLGPRACYGKRLAYLQIRMLLILVLWKFELLEVNGELGSFDAVERLARVPKYCYLRLKEIKM